MVCAIALRCFFTASWIAHVLQHKYIGGDTFGRERERERERKEPLVTTSFKRGGSAYCREWAKAWVSGSGSGSQD